MRFDLAVTPDVVVRVSGHVHAPHGSPLGIALWSFVSDGLRAYGQRELALSLVRRPDEDEVAFPDQALAFFAMIAPLARAGQVVGPGGWTELGAAGLFAPHLRGVVYAGTAGVALGPDPLPDDTLLGIAIDAGELEVVRRAGAYRVLARLGRQADCFPFPAWSDRDRASVAYGAEDHSLLGKLARITIVDASLALDRTAPPFGGAASRGRAPAVDRPRLRLSLPRHRARRVAELLDEVPAGLGLALLTQPAAGAHGWLVWSPGQPTPAAITPPGGATTEAAGETLTGGCLAIAPGLDAGRDSTLMFEDGFALLLRRETWAAFRQAIARGEPFDVPAARPGELAFELAWLERDPLSAAAGRTDRPGTDRRSRGS